MKETGRLIKEYYHTTAALIAYYSCDAVREIERQVLALLCEAMGCPEQLAACWDMIEGARCLQYATDKSLLNMDEVKHSIALDMKMDALLAGKIEKLRCFDAGIFVEELKTNAGFGIKNSCKLYAALNWLGVVIPQNRETAQNIWAMLAMSGERIALDMLIYSYGENTQQRQMWSHIRDILQREQEAFSAIALKSNYPDYTDQELQTANLIMLISQKLLSARRIDRLMLRYALHSSDDFNTKLYKLSANTNYYVELHEQDRAVRKKCGF